MKACLLLFVFGGGIVSGWGNPGSGAATGWGANQFGQVDLPSNLANVVVVGAGAAHGVALLSDGTVAAWGNNRWNQAEVPVGLGGVKAVAAGFGHSLALLDDGTVEAWGSNAFGESTPPSGATNVVAVAAGGFHSLAVRSDGSVIAWGANTQGQVAVPVGLPPAVAVAAGAYHSLALLADGSVRVWGYGINTMMAVPAAAINITAISSGFNHNLALRQDGMVIAWGSNSRGQSAVPSGLTSVAAISAGHGHSLALLADGSIVSWGSGEVVQPVVPEGVRAVQVAAGGDFSIAVVEGMAFLRHPVPQRIVPGEALSFSALLVAPEAPSLQWQRNGVDVPGATNLTLVLSGLEDVDAAEFRLRAMSGGETVFSQAAWLLAPPVITAQPQSVTVFTDSPAIFHVQAAGTGPFRYQWTLNNSPILNATNASHTVTSAISQQGTYRVTVSNSLGAIVSEAALLQAINRPQVGIHIEKSELFSGDTLECVGTTSFGPNAGFQWEWNAMDIPGATNTSLRIERALPSLAGSYRFKVVTDAGRIYSDEVIVAIKPAHPVNHVGRRVYLEAGDAHGLGSGFQWFKDGEILPGATSAVLELDPLDISHVGRYGVSISVAGAPRPVDAAVVTVLPAPPAGRIRTWGQGREWYELPDDNGEDVIALSGSGGLILALRADGRIFHWGAHWHPVVNHHWTNAQPGFALSAMGVAGALGVDGRIFSGIWPGDLAPQETNRFIAVASGGEHALGLLHDGRVAAWGENTSGQTAVPAGLVGVVAVAAGAEHSLALRQDGSVVAWGTSQFGLNTVPLTVGTAIKAIAAGPWHNLALRSNGTVVAWGNSGSGRTTVPPTLTNAVAIAAGEEHSLALRSDGTIVAWGDNSHQQRTVPAGLTGVLAIAAGNAFSAALVGDVHRPVILEHPAGGIRETGGEFTLVSRAWGPVPFAYQWQRNGTNIPGATNATLVLADLEVEDAGEYRVSLIRGSDVVLSDPATVLVNPLPYLENPSIAGALVAWGRNHVGQSNVPADLGLVRWVHGGEWLNMVGLMDGRVRVWAGSEDYILPRNDLVQASAMTGRILALRDNGIVAAWTLPGLTELDPPQGSRGIVQLVPDRVYFGLRGDGTITHEITHLRPVNYFPPGLSNVIQVVVGDRHGAALLSTGVVVMAQDGTDAEHVPPPGLGFVTQLAAGEHHTLALQADGTVAAWGRNFQGQCDVPPGLTNVTAIAAGANFSMALRTSGTVVVWGDNTHGQLQVPPGLTNVIAIAAGSDRCLALRRGPALLAPLEDQIATPGQTVTFSVEAASVEPVTYQWYFQGIPLFGARQSALTVQATGDTAGVYAVDVASSGGVVTAEAMLRLGLPPMILAEPEDRLVRNGTNAFFGVLVSGLAPISYQWRHNGTNVANATNSSYTATSVTTAKAGDYSVVVSNAYGSVTSRVAQLTVVYPPLISQHPASQAVSIGDPVTFTVEAHGAGHPISYQWRFNGTNLAGASAASLVLHEARLEDAGIYSVAVSNFSGVAVSSNAVLSVTRKEPEFVMVPVDQTVPYGSPVHWTVAATGAAPLQFQWTFQDEPLPGAVHGSLSFDAADDRIAGIYSVTVSNVYGSITSPPARLVLTTPPNVVAWGSNNVQQLAVPMHLTNAVAVAAHRHSLALRSDGTVTAWGPGAAAVVPAGLTNVIAVAAGDGHSLALKADGTITAWGANNHGQTNVPTGLSNVVAIAAGEWHNLALKSDGTVAAWGYNASNQATPPAGLGGVIAVAASRNYSIALRNDGTVVGWGNGYVQPPTLTNIVAVAGGARFGALRSTGRASSWIPGASFLPSQEGPAGLAALDVSPLDAGTSTRRIGILTNGTVAVWGNTSDLYAPPGGLSRVTAVAAGFSHNLAVISPSYFSVQPWDAFAREGEAVTFEARVEGGPPNTYQWQFNGSDLPGQTAPVLELASVHGSHIGDYKVIATDPHGAMESRTAYLTVLTHLPYIVRHPAGQTRQAGSTVQFTVDAIGEGGLNYQWMKNGETLPGANAEVLTLEHITVQDAGLYSVRVWNMAGTEVSNEAMLGVGIPDITIDNLDAIVSGPWTSASQTAQIGEDHLRISQGLGLNHVEFRPDLPRAGSYRVLTRRLSPHHLGTHVVGHSEQVSGAGGFLSGATGWITVGIYAFGEGSSGSVRITDAFPEPGGTGIADAVMFTYVPTPPVISHQPEPATVAEGQNASFTVGVVSAIPVSFQWQRDRVNLVGAKVPALVLEDVDREHGGLYRVLVSSADGTLYSREVLLSVVAPPIRWTGIGNDFVLEWDRGVLQWAETVTGPYVDVPNAASPFVIELDQPQMFFRLAH